MSGLESLPPDQRAVLQLILAQGRGYADLAATLRLDPAAVRERAHAGAAALTARAGEDLDAEARGRVVDYLLGQQDAGERIVTYAELGDSPGACRWAHALREQLATLAREELPELPAAAPVPTAVNGSAATATVPEAAAPTAALATIPPVPLTQAPEADAAPAAIPPAAPATPTAPAAPPREPAAPSDAGDAAAARPSRLGGAILIAGALALAVVLAILLIGGDGDDGGSGSSSPATNGAQTQAARTSTGTQTPPTGSNARAEARPIGVASLRAPAGGRGLAAALVQQYRGGRRLIAVQGDRLPGNSGQDFYAIWLQGTAGNRFLGFVPNQVRANGSFLVSADVSDVELSGYSTVLVTAENGGEGASTPTTPGTTVLSGPLRLAG